MNKFLMVVLVAVLAACGSIEESSADAGEVSSQNLVMCPIPCCGNSVTFNLPGCNGTIFPAGNNVPVSTNIVVRFYQAQIPSNIRLSVASSTGAAVSCSWVWSADSTTATCSPQSRFAGLPGLSYGTTYTTTVQRWTRSPLQRIGYWSTVGSATFTTTYLVNAQ
ncbi:MAG: Ig-like domain-containing protein [Meiothermus sp.]|nr:Ig-like domain-containing protein [Meiothermus sp.]